MRAGYTVLIVDRDDSARATLSAACQQAGCTTVEAATINHALGALAHRKLDAIICDRHATTPDGESLLVHVLGVRPTLVRFMCTEPGDVHVAVRAQASGLCHRFILRSWHERVVRQSVGLALQVLVPTLRETDVDAPRSAGTREAAESDRSPARILLVEDDANVRGLVQHAVRAHGFAVTEAPDGDAAIAALAKAPPDIAVVDLNLPGMSGFDVIRILKSSRLGTLPVLVLSSAIDPASRARAFDCGADDFVPKPVHVPELLKRIDAFERSRRAYIEVQRASERAEKLRVYAAEASALLAHDLHNGLAVAQTNVGFLQGLLEPDSDASAAAIDAVASIRRLTSLVKNFVDIARLEDAELVPSRTTTDIARVMRAIAAIHKPVARVANARITVHCADELTATVDPTLFERILHNLVGNAVRYVDHSGEIALRAAMEDDVLTVQVGNTGAAIHQTLASSLFDRYRRGTDAKSRTGMGLYFCRLACEAHGGSIRLAPTDDCRTNFAFALPDSAPTS